MRALLSDSRTILAIAPKPIVMVRDISSSSFGILPKVFVYLLFGTCVRILSELHFPNGKLTFSWARLTVAGNS